MKNQLTFALLATLFITFSGFKSPKTDTNPKGGVVFFSGSYDNLLREARKQKKPIVLEFWAAWCGPCQKLDKETFKNKNLGEYIKDNYLIYKVDIDTFDGMEIVDRFAVDVFPTMLVLDNKGHQISKMNGFYPASFLQKELEVTRVKHNMFNLKPKDAIVFVK